MKKLYKAVFIVLALLLCLAVCSCSSGDYVGNGAPESGSGDVIVSDSTNRKIVYTVNIGLVSKDVVSVKNSVSEKNKALGGYVESSDERFDGGECSYVSVTYRVPTEKLDEFISSVEGVGSVDYKRVYTSDITTDYVNATAQKSALEQQKLLLEEGLNDTALTASDRILLTGEIAKISAELQSLELLINEYDSLVGFSTVRLTVEQPVDYTGLIITLIVIFVGIPAVIVGVVFTARAANKKRKTT